MVRERVKTKRQKADFGYMIDVMEMLEWDFHQPVLSHRRIPSEWREIAKTRYPKKKRRVTMWIEEDIVKFFKSQGTGYQTRMNDVLQAFMLARLSGVIEGRDTDVEFKDWRELPDRPVVGDYDRDMATMKERLAERFGEEAK